MKYIIKNILISFRKNTPMMLLAILTVIISCLTMLFSYGVYMHMKREIATKVSKIYEHPITCNYRYKRVGENRLIRDEKGNMVKQPGTVNTFLRWRDCKKFELKRGKNVDKTATVGELKAFCQDLSDVFCKNLDYVAVKTEIDHQIITGEFSIRNKQFVPSEHVENTLLSDSTFGLKSGRYFTEEEMKKGICVGLFYDYRINSPCSRYHKYLDSIMDKDLRTFRLQGKTYQAIGSYFTIWPENVENVFSPVDSVNVPITALDDDTPLVEDVNFIFKEPMTKPHYDELVSLCKKHFGTLMDPGTVKLVENPDNYMHRSILLVAVCIALVSVVNFVLIYRFILMTRMRELSIFRLCGMSYLKSAVSYILECLLLTTPVFLLSGIFYSKWLIRLVGANFYYMKKSYDPKVYLTMFLIYFVLSVAAVCIMVFGTLRRREVFVK